MNCKSRKKYAQICPYSVSLIHGVDAAASVVKSTLPVWVRVAVLAGPSRATVRTVVDELVPRSRSSPFPVRGVSTFLTGYIKDTPSARFAFLGCHLVVPTLTQCTSLAHSSTGSNPFRHATYVPHRLGFRVAGGTLIDTAHDRFPTPWSSSVCSMVDTFPTYARFHRKKAATPISK